MARMAAFMPGASPPDVNTAMRFISFIVCFSFAICKDVYALISSSRVEFCQRVNGFAHNSSQLHATIIHTF